MCRRPSGNRRLLVSGGSLSGAIALAGVLLALVATGSAAAHAAPRPGAEPLGKDKGPDGAFAAVAAAWTARDAEAVAGHVDPAPKGVVALRLLSDPRVEGDYSQAQARQTLKAYFERLRGTPVLRDVTTAESKRAVPTTRLYDYTYRPEARDPVTTRLEVALKQVSGAWILASVSERPRPRSSASLPVPPR